MKKRIFTFFILSFLLLGCVETVDNHCKSSTDNFSEGYKCIKNAYSNAYSPDSPVKAGIDKDMECGEELSNLVAEGKLKNQQAWYLFWNARRPENENSSQFVCVDWEYLKNVGQAIETRNKKRQGIPNN